MATTPTSPVDETPSPQVAAPKPTPRVDVDPVFNQQLKALQAQAATDATARAQGEQAPWQMPELRDWSGDAFDWDGMASPFDRSYSNDKFVEAISDPQKPGVAGDLIVASLQVDYLACMERSFRSRHTFNRCRTLAQLCGRLAGRGHNKGPLIQGPLEYIRGLVRQSRDGGAS